MSVICPFCNQESYGMAYCDNCGMELPRNKPQAQSRTTPMPKPTPKPKPMPQPEIVNQQPITPKPIEPKPTSQKGMRCPKCKGYNISISESVYAKSKRRSFLWNLLMIMFTCGFWWIWMLVRKRKEKIVHVKMCVCQNCGYSWKK